MTRSGKTLAPNAAKDLENDKNNEASRDRPEGDQAEREEVPE